MSKIPFEALQDFTMASGTAPLKIDHRIALSEASALAVFMGAAFEDADKLTDQDRASEVRALSPSIMISIFSGLGTLIALGCYMADETVEAARAKAAEGRTNG